MYRLSTYANYRPKLADRYDGERPASAGSFPSAILSIRFVPSASPAARFLDLRRGYWLALQLGDQVAQLGGIFVAALIGGFEHLAMQFFDLFLGDDIIGFASSLRRQFASGDLFLDTHTDGGANRLWRDAVLGVVLQLQLAATTRLVDGPLHRIGDAISIENDLGVNVAGRSTNRLNKRCLGA